MADLNMGKKRLREIVVDVNTLAMNGNQLMDPSSLLAICLMMCVQPSELCWPQLTGFGP